MAAALNNLWMYSVSYAVTPEGTTTVQTAWASLFAIASLSALLIRNHFHPGHCGSSFHDDPAEDL